MSDTSDIRTVLILVRHGECSANAEGRFRGRCNFPLNENGLAQAQEVSLALQKLQPEALYSSPLLRARQTLEPASQALNLPVLIDDGLNNVALGQWENRRKKEIAQEFPELWYQWLHSPETLNFPGMENLNDVGCRARAALDRIVAQNKGRRVAVCTHRTVLKPLVPCCLEMTPPWFWKFHFDTGSISILIHQDDQGYSLFSLNRIDHLSNISREWN